MSRTIKDRDGKPYWKPPKVAKRIWNHMRRRKAKRQMFRDLTVSEDVDIHPEPKSDTWNWN